MKKKKVFLNLDLKFFEWEEGEKIEWLYVGEKVLGIYKDPYDKSLQIGELEYDLTVFKNGCFTVATENGGRSTVEVMAFAKLPDIHYLLPPAYFKGRENE